MVCGGLGLTLHWRLREMATGMGSYFELEDYAQPAARLFGDRLKQRRQSLGLTQAELFEQTGITAAYISVIERGKANPTLDMMVKLAEAVGAEAWDMIRPMQVSGIATESSRNG